MATVTNYPIYSYITILDVYYNHFIIKIVSFNISSVLCSFIGDLTVDFVTD